MDARDVIVRFGQGEECPVPLQNVFPLAKAPPTLSRGDCVLAPAIDAVKHGLWVMSC